MGRGRDNTPERTSTLTLSSQIHMTLSGPYEGTIEADHGMITNEPREIVLERPHLRRADGMLQSDRAVFYLGSGQSRRARAGRGQREHGNAGSEAGGAKKSDQKRAAFSKFVPGRPGRVSADAEAQPAAYRDSDRQRAHRAGGDAAMQGDAGRVILDFSGQNQLQTVHALDGARSHAETGCIRRQYEERQRRIRPPGFRTYGAGALISPWHRDTFCSARSPPARRRSRSSSPAQSFRQAGLSATHRRDSRQVRRQVRIGRWSESSSPAAWRARRSDRELNSGPAGPRQHQRLGRCDFSSARRNRVGHAAGKRRLSPTARPPTSACRHGRTRALHACRPDARAHRQPARGERRHGDDGQDNPA